MKKEYERARSHEGGVCPDCHGAVAADRILPWPFRFFTWRCHDCSFRVYGRIKKAKPRKKNYWETKTYERLRAEASKARQEADDAVAELNEVWEGVVEDD